MFKDPCTRMALFEGHVSACALRIRFLYSAVDVDALTADGGLDLGLKKKKKKKIAFSLDELGDNLPVSLFCPQAVLWSLENCGSLRAIVTHVKFPNVQKIDVVMEPLVAVWRNWS